MLLEKIRKHLNPLVDRQNLPNCIKATDECG